MKIASWYRLSRQAKLRVEGDGIRAAVGRGREQLVAVEDYDDGYLLSSRILRPGAVSAMPDLAVEMYRANRLSEMVCFRITDRGWLVGEAWVPAAGLGVEEWRFCVQKVAAVCDRMESVLAGVDRE